MELEAVIDGLRRPEAYPHPVEEVRVVQTHISVVFLAGPYAYKLKKPVDLGFVDYGSVEKRLHFCKEEVRLNRRLARPVYLGVAPVRLRQDASGLVVGPCRDRPEGEAGEGEGPAGETVDHVVKMKRLPEERSFRSLLERGELEPELLRDLADKLAAFHRDADAGERISRVGGWETVAGNTEENFRQSEPYVGRTVSERVFRRLRRLSDERLEEHRELMERRTQADVPRDTHGDLRLEHVFSFPEADPGERLLVVDCIEFNERFRYADPMADVAFLVMELESEGERRLCDAFTRAYFARREDPEGPGLLPFYVSYRHVVRGKVASIKVAEPEVTPARRVQAEARAVRHFLGAFGKLAPFGERPCLVLTAGLPGVGKSTLARELAAQLDFVRHDSDVVRKRLAGLPGGAEAGAGFEEGIYTPAWTEKTYAELLRLARADLFEGRRVVVDASFSGETQRRAFLEAAREAGVPGLLLLCEAAPAIVRDRLGGGREGVSDADWNIHLEAAGRWEPLGERTRCRTVRISTEGDVEEAFLQAVRALEREGLEAPDAPVALARPRRALPAREKAPEGPRTGPRSRRR